MLKRYKGRIESVTLRQAYRDITKQIINYKNNLEPTSDENLLEFPCKVVPKRVTLEKSQESIDLEINSDKIENLTVPEVKIVYFYNHPVQETNKICLNIF